MIWCLDQIYKVRGPEDQHLYKQGKLGLVVVLVLSFFFFFLAEIIQSTYEPSLTFLKTQFTCLISPLKNLLRLPPAVPSNLSFPVWVLRSPINYLTFFFFPSD